jgi:ABC-type nitrate/sulfonate/bicarbonate transport system ATPase subunit
VLVTHDLAQAAALADRGLVLARGRASWLDGAPLASGEALAAAYREAVPRLEAAA